MSDRTAADPPVRALLIDDDRDDYLLTRSYFEDMPAGRFTLEWVDTYEAGLAAVAAGGHDVYLLDYRLGAKTGLDLLREARERGPIGPVILLTGQGQFDVDQAAMEAGAADFLEKARLDATILERSIRYALQQKRYEAELERKVRERTAALLTEIAERKRAEEALKAADRRKDEFLATLAHELRNPLAPIRNSLEILRIAPNNPTALQNGVAMMDRQIRAMVRLIDDLLDVSRITRGKLRLEPESLELREVVDAAVETAQPLIDKAGLTLAVAKPSKPLKMVGDRVRLTQVIGNLLNNAAKYTETGGRVDLTVAKDGNEAVIRVRDTGVGIPAEHLGSVFDLFTQVDRSLNRSQGGLGIGLGLVKKIVEMHGGTVEAHSGGIGQGAEFVVRLPTDRPLTEDGAAPRS